MAPFDFDVVSAQPAPKTLSALAAPALAAKSAELPRHAPQAAVAAKPAPAQDAARR